MTGVNEYATSEQLKATLELTGETFADADIGRALTAASRGLEQLCGRRFWADENADQVRHYTPEHPCYLRIDDLIELTSLATDEDGDGTFETTWTVNTDFLLEPLNAAADGRPWEEIRAHPIGRFRFPCLPRSVEIHGRFGWADVPDVVTAATIIIATKLLKRMREAPFGVVQFGMEGGAVRIARTDPDVMFLVGDLIRTRIAVA